MVSKPPPNLSILGAESLKGMITTSQRLRGLPEQIAQAGDYVKVASTPLGISKGNGCRTLQASLDGNSEVITGMSLSHLAGRSVESTSLFATELLSLCSIFHCADIPMETLKERYDPFDNEGKCHVQPSVRCGPAMSSALVMNLDWHEQSLVLFVNTKVKFRKHGD